MSILISFFDQNNGTNLERYPPILTPAMNVLCPVPVLLIAVPLSGRRCSAESGVIRERTKSTESAESVCICVSRRNQVSRVSCVSGRMNACLEVELAVD